MSTCPFWIASVKGVTPHLSLLSGLYGHLGRKTKPRTELLAALKSSLYCCGGRKLSVGSEMAYPDHI